MPEQQLYFFEHIYPKWTDYHGSIVANKLSQDGKFSFYSINHFYTFLVWSTISSKPALNEFPFDYAEVLWGSDTLISDSKEKIIVR